MSKKPKRIVSEARLFEWRSISFQCFISTQLTISSFAVTLSAWCSDEVRNNPFFYRKFSRLLSKHFFTKHVTGVKVAPSTAKARHWKNWIKLMIISGKEIMRAVRYWDRKKCVSDIFFLVLALVFKAALILQVTKVFGLRF